MGKKADQKKKYILEHAKKIFAEKGFKNVRMNDIVCACNISRGGVYLYFSSTSELLEALLHLKAEPELASKPISDSYSATEYIVKFLNEQKNDLLNPRESLILAQYEYLFVQNYMTHSSTPLPTELENKFANSVTQLSQLIQYGVDNKEFFVDPCVAAQNIILLLEGLRISSTVLAFDEAFIDRHIVYIVSQLTGKNSQ